VAGPRLTLDEPQPVYDERTRGVVVGYDVTNTTQEDETEQTLYAAECAVESKAAAADTSICTDAETDLEAEVGVRLCGGCPAAVVHMLWGWKE